MANMSKNVYIIIKILTISSRGLCIWPPPYEIKLNDEETFVISSDFYENSDEDEMIPSSDLKRLKNEDKEKYFRIHQIAIRENKREMIKKRDFPRNITKIKEHNFDLEDTIPWEGGFVDKSGNFMQPENENVYYLNEMAKNLIDTKINQKREEMDENKEHEAENYDYKNFKAEYETEIKKLEKQSDTLNFTDVKEDESLEESVENIINFKNESKNCTAEEMKGIGFFALKCIVSDLKTSKDKKSMIMLAERILRISLIWFCVYLVIAVPCWCQRGWCCCCCCCKMCRPRERIDEAKRFFVENPVGVFHTKEGVKLTYQATTYEIYAQRRLERELLTL